jgi:hypothetical protein
MAPSRESAQNCARRIPRDLQRSRGKSCARGRFSRVGGNLRAGVRQLAALCRRPTRPRPRRLAPARLCRGHPARALWPPIRTAILSYKQHGRLPTPTQGRALRGRREALEFSPWRFDFGVVLRDPSGPRAKEPHKMCVFAFVADRNGAAAGGVYAPVAAEYEVRLGDGSSVHRSNGARRFIGDPRHCGGTSASASGSDPDAASQSEQFARFAAGAGSAGVARTGAGSGSRRARSAGRRRALSCAARSFKPSTATRQSVSRSSAYRPA